MTMPTFLCPRCGSNDAYYAPRQIGVNVENWGWTSNGPTKRLPNSTQWKTINQALCRQCGEIVQVAYSKQELKDNFWEQAEKVVLIAIGVLIALVASFGIFYLFLTL
jgi:DNA-directed RNA polymerase subunit M/transcription elongation factor TFIIS